MKHTKLRPDQQGQQNPQIQHQQKQQQKSGKDQGRPRQSQDEVNYQEHEHPESRMTD